MGQEDGESCLCSVEGSSFPTKVRLKKSSRIGPTEKCLTCSSCYGELDWVKVPAADGGMHNRCILEKLRWMEGFWRRGLYCGGGRKRALGCRGHWVGCYRHRLQELREEWSRWAGTTSLFLSLL